MFNELAEELWEGV